MLEPEMELGLKILAYIHSGELELNCSTCDDASRSKLYCSGVSENPIIMHDEMGEFYSCPARFISASICEFWDEYLYYQTFEGSAPDYWNVTSRFWEASKIYKSTYDKSVRDQQEKKQKQKNPNQNTGSSLAKLRHGLEYKKKRRT